MTKIVLSLKDDEFLELGGLAYGYVAAQQNHSVGPLDKVPGDNSIGRLLLKIKNQIDLKATPGQLQHLQNVVTAIREAFAEKEVDTMMVTEGFAGIMSAAGEKLQDDEG